MYPEEEILAFPQEVNILFNVSIDQLINCRKEINRIIRKMKQEKEEPPITDSK